MYLLSQFWAPRKLYTPCGMFTDWHMFLLFLFIIILCVLLAKLNRLSLEKTKKVIKFIAIIITFFEVIKIYFNFYWGYTWINAWFPMAYCSIFIYSLWMSGFGKGKYKEGGDAFLACGALVAGIAYLLFPSTALTMYPIGHYLSLYSMIFHTLMVCIGVIYLSKFDVQLNKSTYTKYKNFYLFFAVIASLLNIIFGSNLMFLRKPSSIPIRLLHSIYDLCPIAYTSIIFLTYLFVPYYFSVIIKKCIKSKRLYTIMNFEN